MKFFSFMLGLFSVVMTPVAFSEGSFLDSKMYRVCHEKSKLIDQFNRGQFTAIVEEDPSQRMRIVGSNQGLQVMPLEKTQQNGHPPENPFITLLNNSKTIVYDLGNNSRINLDSELAGIIDDINKNGVVLRPVQALLFVQGIEQKGCIYFSRQSPVPTAPTKP